MPQRASAPFRWAARREGETPECIPVGEAARAAGRVKPKTRQPREAMPTPSSLALPLPILVVSILPVVVVVPDVLEYGWMDADTPPPYVVYGFHYGRARLHLVPTKPVQPCVTHVRRVGVAHRMSLPWRRSHGRLCTQNCGLHAAPRSGLPVRSRAGC